jgi:hypothetical protein
MKSSISRSAAWLFTTRKRTPTRLSYQDEIAVRLPHGCMLHHLLQAASLPSNSLVPTLETKVRFLRASSGAAQLKRWA